MIIDKILDAVEKEYYEHSSCGYEIGCILTSKTLIEELNKIIIEDRKICKEKIIEELKKKSFFCCCKGKEGVEID